MPWTALIDTCLDDLNLILRRMIRAGYNELPPPVISGQIHHYNGICKIGVSTDRDAIWQHRTRSTLAQIMSCCQMTPSHYLNQYWLRMKDVLWHSPQSNFISAHDMFGDCTFKFIATDFIRVITMDHPQDITFITSMNNSVAPVRGSCNLKLERLERLRSEDTPGRLMITHSIESNWIPSQKKTKSKLQI